jgi:peptidyl-prolyl cis-trans isomerase D
MSSGGPSGDRYPAGFVGRSDPSTNTIENSRNSMSFEVFRRHQRKLLAIFAILAMFGFVVSDSLPRLLSSNTSGRDQLVVKVYDRPIYQSDIQEMAQERSYANQIMSRLPMVGAYLGPNFFGGLKTREMVDALILRHEADRLGLPSGPEVGREFLKQVMRGQMNGEVFNLMMADFNNRVSDEQVLSAIADQVRMRKVMGLLGGGMVTPYDIFRAYRDQSEKVSARLVEVPVSKFLPQVPEPSADEVQAYYDRYKDVLPDPARPTPGFKVPRQVQVEILSIDGNARARYFKDQLSEAELRTAYENRKAEFEVQPGPGDLPNDLFAGQPEQTPPVIRSFSDVRGVLASSLAEDKAQAEIIDKFEKIKKDVLDPFFDSYQDALDDQEEAKKQGSQPGPLPSPPDLKDAAQRNGLIYELSPMLSREEAERYGTISDAKVGLTRGVGGRTFADEFFDAKTALYESVELIDLGGTRYLVRKIKDAAPRVPPLDEVRSQVVLAWKTEKARPLAEKAADQVADQLRKQKSVPKDATFQGYPVVLIPAIARLQSSPMNLSTNPFRMDEPQESPISVVPFPGDAFRKEYFSLRPDSVVVVPNQPKTSYYAMMLDRREPATFATLYALAGDEYRYKSLAKEHADRQLVENWMAWLRRQAKIDPNWVPSDEAKEKEAASKRS